MYFKGISVENNIKRPGNKELEETLKRVGETFRVISQKTPPAIKTLAMHGWHIPFDSIPGEVFGYAEALEKGHIGLVNDKLVSIFEKNLSNIISRACTSFPDRTEMLMEAKLAHESKMYFASTSLFLSNADGILNGRLYKNEALKKEFRDRGIIINEFTNFLIEETSINRQFSPNKNLEQTNDLNRHGVLHGRVVNYGTKINSLKALSLLDYVSVFVLP